MKRRNCRSVKWDIFKTNNHFNDIPTNIENVTAEEMIKDFYSRLNGAIEEATRAHAKKPFYSKCWWSAYSQPRWRRGRMHIKLMKRESLQ